MKKIILLSIISLLGAGAYADSIDAQFSGTEAGGISDLDLGGDDYSFYNFGLYRFDTQNASGALASHVGSHVWGFCFDADDYIGYGNETYSVGTLESSLGSDKAGLINQLWANHYNSAWETSTFLENNGLYYPPDTASNRKALAMALAIYEIVYEDSQSPLDISSGNFKVHSTGPVAAEGIAQGWLDNLVDLTVYTGPTIQLATMTAPGYQDMIIQIPEPASMAMIGLVSGGAVFVRRWFAI